ncbi:MAG TPA: DUF72 domain-containing protein [Actinomycetota bacterium]|jgi:uncharacterized protein YecE (DUF72 family)|nr:DUF72 domain-containing protein [Actinomycetota bacterium]
MPVLVGTSGWQYRDWRGRFYPERLAQARWLEHYAAQFATVESNNAFYRLPEPRTFAAWAARTPEDFVMAVKASRFLTHVKRLRDPEEPVRRFVRHAGSLGAKLGPVLLQLPPSLRADLAALRDTLERFPPGLRVAVEPRHQSWFSEPTRALLAERGVALCLADSPHRTTPLWRTAGWGYVRFHEGTATPRPCYSERALTTWAARLADLWDPDAQVFVYFNNDPGCAAVYDAARFARAAARVGLRPTRTPLPSQVRVG